VRAAEGSISDGIGLKSWYTKFTIWTAIHNALVELFISITVVYLYAQRLWHPVIPSEVSNQAQQPVTVSGGYPEPVTVDFAHPNSVRHNSLAVGQPMPSQNLHHLILKGHYTDVACLFDQGLQLLLHMFFQHDLDTVTLCVRAWQEPCF